MMIVWLVAAFLCGALPFSVWLGRLALRTDIRRYGDGNPGATNVFRAGGKWIGVLAAILDGAKGMLPVLLARFVAGWQGWELAALALMP
ncbi:MAG: glycerol-3-phosphate acyltransferase, partial [Anaerolineae bacterium]|nr:glycerol-3-phosphate acyltransferase [Anaerolineae bacterium]